MTNENPPVAPIEAPEAVRAIAPIELQDNAPGVVVLADPTQIRRPWRATARTVFQALLSLAVLAPLIVAAVEEATGWDLSGVPFVVLVLALCAAIARIMSLPGVETFLRTFVPFLAAAPKD